MLIVFDEWYNGVPIVYIIACSCKLDNMQPWMHVINDHLWVFKANWHANAFEMDGIRTEINNLKLLGPHNITYLCVLQTQQYIQCPHQPNHYVSWLGSGMLRVIV